jgi:hypothetical protein
LLFEARFMRRFAVISLALSACSFGDEPRVVSADDPLPADLVAGDVIVREGLELAVPETASQISIVGEREDGSAVELTIRLGSDGLIEVLPPEPPAVLEAASTAPCQDGAFNLSGHAWKMTYRWHFQAGSTPSVNSKTNVETALIRAANAITSSRNDCGLADEVSATNEYLGRTAAAPAIRGTSTGGLVCGSTDGKSVVGFGRLPAGFLAVACTWSDGNGNAVEGDIKYNTRNSWYALSVPAGCSNRFGIQGVGAHEFGHVFGLAHVSESAHPNLTMSTAGRSCSNAELSLGLGDVRALRQLY